MSEVPVNRHLANAQTLRDTPLAPTLTPKFLRHALDPLRPHLTPEQQQAVRAERVKRVAAKRAEGKSLRAIAAEEGVSVKTVHQDMSGATGVAPDVAEGKSLRAIAAEEGVSPPQVLADLRESGVNGLTPEVPGPRRLRLPPAEQAIRPAVVNRKVWGGNRTPAGAEAQGVLMSVIETCRRQARSALDFVSETLRAFGNRDLSRPILLTGQ
jgi:transposase